MDILVAKISESGKTMLVGVRNEFNIAYQFGWCRNPGGFSKGDKIPAERFQPKGLAPIQRDGEVLKHKDGTPVMQWQF